jgi:hypothetical protein
MKNRNKNIAIACLILIVAVGSFFIGTIYQKSQKSSGSQVSDSSIPSGYNRSNGQNFTPGSGSSFRGGGASGTIDSISGSTITVKSTSGTTETVTIGSSTTITKSQTMAASDLVTGQTISVMGTTNSDGSVTARNITIR